jgi:hypothetical protein
VSRLGLVGSRLIDFTTFMIVFFSERFYRVSDVAALIDIGTTLDCSIGLYCCYAAFVVLVSTLDCSIGLYCCYAAFVVLVSTLDCSIGLYCCYAAFVVLVWHVEVV